ncbi:MAG: DUF4252 domain-containing protein [Candidatus Cryptobacteroides sp.]
MKKIFAVLALILVGALGLWAKNDIDSLTKLAKEYQNKEGFEVVNLSGFSFSVIRALSAFSDADDESEEALKMLKGVKSMLVVDYEEAKKKDKDSFNAKADAIFKDMELLMEAQDEGELVRMYGQISKDGKTLSDFVIYSPGEGALVCFKGKIAMDQAMRLATE